MSVSFPMSVSFHSIINTRRNTLYFFQYRLRNCQLLINSHIYFESVFFRKIDIYASRAHNFIKNYTVRVNSFFRWLLLTLSKTSCPSPLVTRTHIIWSTWSRKANELCSVIYWARKWNPIWPGWTSLSGALSGTSGTRNTGSISFAPRSRHDWVSWIHRRSLPPSTWKSWIVVIMYRSSTKVLCPP